MSQPDVDVLVAGSGAAGLVTALTCAVAGLRVVVCERSAELGGTTALSGGRVWVPGNHFQPDPDSDRRAAQTYLAGVFDPRYAAMTTAFLDGAPAMLRHVEAHTPHRFAQCPNYPDYHPDRPGATLGGRCLDMLPLDLTTLTGVSAELAGKVRVPPGYLPMTHAEWERWRYPGGYDRDLLDERAARHVVTGGVALTAALLAGVVRAGGTVVTGRRIVDVERLGGRLNARLSTGQTVPAANVVLATGGFDQNDALRARHLPGALDVSGASPSNTGDALAIAERFGARLDNLDQGWWMPMVVVPGEEVDGAPAYRSLIRERGAPRLIIVDAWGRRFVDEAAPYNEIGKALHRHGGPAHLIVDEGFRRRYGLPHWGVRADSPAELAQRLGIDADGLTDQVARWNKACALGTDEECGKGANAYDRYYGDPDLPEHPNLGPLDEPPFYGIRVLAGTIGSKGGPVTDTGGTVLDRDGRPIAGLYAVGNAAAFWTADGYPGPGATLGIGMTFGYRAGLSIST